MRCAQFCGFTAEGFPIRKSPDRRLLHISPGRIAVTLRPSSPFDVKASTMCPYANHPNADLLISFKIYWKKFRWIFLPKLRERRVAHLTTCNSSKGRQTFMCGPFLLSASACLACSNAIRSARHLILPPLQQRRECA